MSLVAKQHRFAQLVARLLRQADEMGYQVTLGEAYRPPELAQLYAEQGRGIAASTHTLRLAVDLNLFRDGVYLTDSEDHRPIGEIWESYDPECRWGGRFTDSAGRPQPDGNHYSLEHNGVK